MYAQARRLSGSHYIGNVLRHCSVMPSAFTPRHRVFTSREILINALHTARVYVQPHTGPRFRPHPPPEVHWRHPSRFVIVPHLDIFELVLGWMFEFLTVSYSGDDESMLLSDIDCLEELIPTIPYSDVAVEGSYHADDLGRDHSDGNLAASSSDPFGSVHAAADEGEDVNASANEDDGDGECETSDDSAIFEIVQIQILVIRTFVRRVRRRRS